MARRPISKELWQQLQPLIPAFVSSAKGGARKLAVGDQATLNGILFALPTGIPWEKLIKINAVKLLWQDKFPLPTPMSNRSTGWFGVDIENWLQISKVYPPSQSHLHGEPHEGAEGNRRQGSDIFCGRIFDASKSNALGETGANDILIAPPQEVVFEWGCDQRGIHDAPRTQRQRFPSRYRREEFLGQLVRFQQAVKAQEGALIWCGSVPRQTGEVPKPRHVLPY